MAVSRFNPSKDAYMSEDTPTANFNNAALWIADTGIGAGRFRSLLSFDISSFPSGVTIISAPLVIRHNGRSGTPAGKIAYLYKMTRPTWVEDEATWTIYSTGNNWTSAGGDFVTSNPSGAEATIPSDFVDMTWDVKTLLEDAITNSIDLHLILRIQDDAGSDGDLATFSSSTGSQAPVLTMTYGGEAAGLYAVVEERFHYVDAYGVERFIQGEAV